MNGWITGEKSVEKVSLVRSAFHSGRKKFLDDSFGPSDHKFHPIFSSSKFANKEILSLVNKIENSRSSRLYNFEADYLKMQHELYAGLADLNLLWPQKDTHSIYTSISKELPSAAQEFAEALKLIRENGDWLGDMLDTVLVEIVPLKGRNGDARTAAGFSDYNILGAIFTGLYEGPYRVIDLATAFVHELGHQVLMLQQAGLLPITEESFTESIYSGVRKTKRPAIAAFHAVVALTYMNEMYKKLLLNYHFSNSTEKFYTEKKFEENNRNLIDGLVALETIDLTKLGNRIVEDINSTL